MIDTFLFIVGALIISYVVVRFFYPNFCFSKSLIALLQKRGTKKGFIVAHNINGLLLGATLILTCFLPEHLKLHYCMPLLLIIFLSVLICNKIFVGTIWAYVPKSRE